MTSFWSAKQSKWWDFSNLLHLSVTLILMKDLSHGDSPNRYAHKRYMEPQDEVSIEVNVRWENDWFITLPILNAVSWRVRCRKTFSCHYWRREKLNKSKLWKNTKNSPWNKMWLMRVPNIFQNQPSILFRTANSFKLTVFFACLRENFFCYHDRRLADSCLYCYKRYSSARGRFIWQFLARVHGIVMWWTSSDDSLLWKVFCAVVDSCLPQLKRRGFPLFWEGIHFGISQTVKLGQWGRDASTVGATWPIVGRLWSWRGLCRHHQTVMLRIC